jgi:hypothetical protein
MIDAGFLFDNDPQQLAAAIGGTARNPATVAPFTASVSDSPTRSEMQAFGAYVESLRATLLR